MLAGAVTKALKLVFSSQSPRQCQEQCHMEGSWKRAPWKIRHYLVLNILEACLVISLRACENWGKVDEMADEPEYKG